MKIPSIKVKKCRISSQCREEISTDGYVQTSLHGKRTRSYPSIGKEATLPTMSGDNSNHTMMK